MTSGAHSTICPTTTAADADGFRQQMEKIATYATRVHIDVADGLFTPRALLPIADIWWPGGMQADIHVMYEAPQPHVEALIALRPQLVIIHAEAEGSFPAFAAGLRQHGIQVGVALLPATPVSFVAQALPVIDHVLVFSGNLGYQGGSQADLSLLQKVTELRSLKPQLEIGWDGGVTADNAAHLAAGGVDVLNVGGFLQTAADQAGAYASLVQAV